MFIPYNVFIYKGINKNMQDQQEIQEKFPFFTMLTYGEKEYFGIVQNQDNAVTSFYDYNVLVAPEEKKQFVELGETWWWESNRQIPIDVFLFNEMREFRNCLKTFNNKDIEIIFGPVTSTHNLVKKRIKRRTIQLVKKTD